MSEYLPIPVDAARTLADRYAKSIVIILAWDPIHALTHTVSYGRSPGEKVQAAGGADACALALGLDLGKKETHEDFRLIDQAERAAEIEQLRKAAKAADHLLGSLLAVRHGAGDALIVNVRESLQAAVKGSEPA